jgi:ABC-type multidrug transport system ATPase subunit
VVALEGVSFSVPAGVCQALCGENGAGKSTLGNLLAGIHAVDQGQLRLFGQPVRFARPADARRAGVSMVHQELAFADNLSIAENLCLARLPRRWGFVDRRELAAQARRLLAAIGVDGGAGHALDVHRPVAALTVGEQQLVQIAGAVGGGARLIVLDEPTSSLTGSEVERLFVLLDRLKAQGVTLLYVTHRMPEIFRLCERVTVLRDGRHVITRDRAGLTEAELVRAMIGIVHDRQTLDAPAFRTAIKDEIHGPDFVRGLRPHQWLTLTHRHLLACTASHLQLGLSIESFNPLVIHHATLLPHLQVNHACPVPPMAMGEGDNGIPQIGIPVRRGLVPQAARTHPDHLQGLALRQASATHPAHHLPTSRCAYHFFLSTSWVTACSSSASASNFFSRAFSCSSVFSRLASDTSRPPNLRRQR